MSQLTPELEELFTAAAAAQPTEEEVQIVMRRTATSPRPAVLRRVSGIGAVVMSILVVSGVGAIGAVATGWSPMGLGGSDPVQLVTTEDPVPPALLEQIAALRGPAMPKDRDADARKAAEVVPNSGPVHSNGIRLVGTSPLGERMYLVPVHDDVDTGRDPHGSGTDSYAAVALVVRGKYGGIGTVGPSPLSSILSPRGLLSLESPAVGPGADALKADPSVPEPLRTGSWFAEIVPDGVATVRVTYSDDTFTDLGVRNNVALGHSDRDLGGTKVAWLDASGATIQQAP